MMTVKILGTGCTKCRTLEERVRQLVEKHQLPIEVQKVTDIDEMVKHGILMTPGLIIDGVVKSVGIIPKDAQLLEWMKGSHG